MDRNSYVGVMVAAIAVALRKESVDRNRIVKPSYRTIFMSLSARRAWIEMDPAPKVVTASDVALRKESVDRNKLKIMYRAFRNCRSPQGERG